ncbi:lysophospholipid acyltransferase family protein [Caldovatus aquaticus]|uniref:1-acyl-sn-glycerol-3-phosphate acyltransferase n=1 Tax=Caldovatus aquaticus TaxID=2865671 RepID=A0ABS7F5P3_9PROT|nr:lysophospholipid acyltransferase family protein [Caldovatus aquaticus]MBW8270126.1 1-acyl-sn-glycerol-3-phosphate acyltransferase [Caldovatus aquaticus]
MSETLVLLRSALFNLAFFALTATMALLALPLLAAPPRFAAGAVRCWARGVLWLLRTVVGLRLRVTGREHLPRGGPAIIAAKHQSAFDTIVWLVLLERPVYVLKRELLRIPFWGWIAAHCGHVAVDRAAGGAALRRMVREAAAALGRGAQVVIFPEGTRTAPGERVPYQPGVAALAAAAGPAVPVLPAATDSGRFWGRRAFRKRPGTLTVAILPPLPGGLPRAELMARLEAAIEGEAARLLAPATPSREGCG